MLDPTVATLRLNLPLDPLQDLSYLNDLCSSVLGKFFLEDTKDDVLTKQARRILRSLWILTFGIPRAIEFLFAAISKHKHILLKDKISHGEKLEITAALNVSIRNYFVATGRTSIDIGKNYNIDPQNWQRICLEASLCLPNSPLTRIQ